MEDEKIDAIADQIGEMKLDELYKEAEGLFAAQLDAEAQNQRTGAELMHSMVDDAVDSYNYAYQYFAQAEAEASDSFDDFLDGALDEVEGFVEENAEGLVDQLADAAKSVVVGKA